MTALRLTGPQLRVLHETLAVILNDPFWFDENQRRDHQTLANAHEKIMEAWRENCREHGTPAVRLDP